MLSVLVNNISILLGKPTKSEEANNPDELELQHVSLHEVIPCILISQEGSKPRKRFQARTSCRRELIEKVQRKRTLELRSTFSDEAQRAMGILHVQSLLLQKLAREENRVRGLSKGSSESSCEEPNLQLANVSDSQDLLRNVGSAVGTLWM